MTKQDEHVVQRLLEAYGQTYAEQSGIRLEDKPSPLYQLAVLAMLLSARIRADVAVAAARELFAAGFKTPKAMAEASWQERVDALGRGHYRRYDERTSTMLGDGAQLLLDDYRGDLRRMRREAGDDVGKLRDLLKRIPGIGDVGTDIFFREAQGIWPVLQPFIDRKAIAGAKRLALPTGEKELSRLVAARDLPRFTAALVRASLDKSVVAEIRDAS